MKQLTALASTALMAVGVALAQAPAARPQAQQQGQTQSRQAMRERMAQELNLNESQQAQANDIFERARTESEPIRAQVRANREKMTEAVKSNNAEQIRNLAADQGTLQGRLLAIREEAAAKFYATLTPEQRAKADQLRQNAERRWHGGRRPVPSE